MGQEPERKAETGAGAGAATGAGADTVVLL